MAARVAPAAMLFIPCEGGRSHVPDESCSLEDLHVAAQGMTDAGRTLLTHAARRSES